MRKTICSVFVATAAWLVAPQIASASTYESYHCGCTAPQGEHCSCTYDYTLGKLATKEFRAYCSNIGGDTPVPDIEIHNLNTGNTCTIQATDAFASPPYRSRSCTNWSLTKTDSINVETICYNQTDGGGTP